MKIPKFFNAAFLTMFAFFCLFASVAAQEQAESKVAKISATVSGVSWNVLVANSGTTLVVAAPDGRVFRKEFHGGAWPEFRLTDAQSQRLPDGTYTYELRVNPEFSVAMKSKLGAERGKDDEPEQVRSTRKRTLLPVEIESGSFAIVNGEVIVAGRAEEQRPTARPKAQGPAATISDRTLARMRNHVRSFPDEVIPDDLIVQGSACVGFDCVSGESFGFDTIKLKENNLRIKFEDTSTSAGFPTNDWQLTANDSASGGSSKFSIEDITGAKVPFTITAGAPTNSIFVDSTGRVGLRTSVPVLDVHANTGNTPAIRLEQNNSGGFTAQTWDIAGNEANFFVRDVTSGSLLPFRIRPGAPTSSIDISATGKVGIGTASPGAKLTVVPTAIGDGVRIVGNTTAPISPAYSLFDSSTQRGALGLAEAAGHFSSSAVAGDIIFQATTGKLLLQTGTGAASLAINAGQIGIGTTSPTATLSVNGTANKPGGGSWDVFSDVRLKNIKGRFSSGLSAVMQLRPLRYQYKPDNALGLKAEGEYVGFAAQELQKIIPEAVTRNDNGYLTVNNDPIIWTMLNAIKEQQKQIADLKAEVQKLRAASPRRKR